jgi:hypothetical protein
MEDGVFFMDVFVGKDQFKGNFLVIDEPPQGTASINAQDAVPPQPTAQALFDCGFGLIMQYGINHRAMPISGHQNRDLLAGESAFLCLAATFSGWAEKLAATFEGWHLALFILDLIAQLDFTSMYVSYKGYGPVNKQRRTWP